LRENTNNCTFGEKWPEKTLNILYKVWLNLKQARAHVCDTDHEPEC
jgi:hypothetical protein